MQWESVSFHRNACAFECGCSVDCADRLSTNYAVADARDALAAWIPDSPGSSTAWLPTQSSVTWRQGSLRHERKTRSNTQLEHHGPGLERASVLLALPRKV
jgi:spore germination cell wall hydrolase CwlJ-like protein